MLYDPVYLVQEAKSRFTALRFGLHPQVFSPGLMRAAVRSSNHMVELGCGVYRVSRSVVDCYRRICFCQAWRHTHRPCRHMLAVMLRSSYHPWEPDQTAGPAPQISHLTCRIHGKRGTWEIIDKTPAGLWECFPYRRGVWIDYVQADQIYNVTPIYKEIK